MKFFQGYDFLLPFYTCLIGILGVVLVWSLMPQLFLSQLIFFLLAFLVFFLFSQIDFRVFENLYFLIYILIISVLFLTSFLGEVTRGAIRWIQIGQFAFQTSEIAKPFILLVLSYFFTQKQFSFSRLIRGGFLFLLPVLLIFCQPDLGSAVVLSAGFLGILLSMRLPRILFFAGFASLFCFSPFLWLFLAEYQKQRLISFLSPASDPLGAGYNLTQAIISIGSGQLFGRGLGKGSQSALAFLPERHTDFIFASLSEAWGLVGAAIVIVLYFLILSRVLRIAEKTTVNSAQVFCFSVFTLLLFQIFVNIGMNLGLLPVTGITLPFLSYGGSSLFSLMITLGIVENIARLDKRQETIEIR